MDQQQLHRALLEPQAWPDAEAGRVTFTETHISRLYFVGERVYKVKKPADFGFLDFTTLDKRARGCRDEVRLNDRFAPDTYLGVAEIRRENGRIRVAGPGEVVEYAVVMRRLPEDRMLDRLLAAGAPGLETEMERLAVQLAELHEHSPVHREDGADYARVCGNWEENFRQSAPLVGVTLEAPALEIARRRVEDFLAAEKPLLLQREREGRVRDGHGDLHAEHICLTDPIRIYDCIEFNRRFRIADTAADLAFLLMDLDFRGRRDLAGILRDRYLQAAGEDAAALEVLLPFYTLYRAWVRGKVDSFLAVDESADAAARREAAGRARRYFNLALGYLVPRRLIMTCGLMGTGKSTVAAALAAATGAPVLRSDEIRKQLAGERSEGSGELAFGAGIYAPSCTAATYDRLRQAALEQLAAGRTVIADASFSRRSQRDRLRRAARTAGIETVLVWADCPADVALQRLAERREAGGDPSDGRPELYREQAQRFAAPAAEERPFQVDTTRDVDYNVHLLLCRLAGRGPS